MSDFTMLAANKSEFLRLKSKGGALGFFGEESLRLITFSGTLKNPNFKLSKSATVDERNFTHVLIRSLLENYFWVLYLFDDLSDTDSRFERRINTFKIDYQKMINDPMMTAHKSQLPTVTWNDVGEEE